LDANEAEKLVMGMGDGKVVSVKGSDGARYVFVPIRDRRAYAVKQAKDPKYPDGVLISAADVNKIMDAFS